MFVLPRGSTEWLVAGFIFLVPISWSPFPWNVQWSELVFLLLLLSVSSCSLPSLDLDTLDWAILVFIGTSAVSLINSGDLVVSGIELSKLFYLTVLYRTIYAVSRHPEACDRIVGWLAGSAVVAGSIGLTLLAVRMLLGSPLVGVSESILPTIGSVLRLKGTFHSAVFLGNYMSFMAPLVLILGMRGQGSRWRWLSGAVVLLAALFSVSHALIGLMAAILAVYWRSLGFAGQGKLRMAGLAAVLVGFVAVNVVLTVSPRDLSISKAVDPTFEEPSSVYEFSDAGGGAERLTVTMSYNWMSYFLLKRAAWDAFRQHPIAGLGLGQFPEAAESAFQAGRLQEHYRGIADPHSTWFGALAESGILGGVGLCVLWFVSLRQSAALLRRATDGGLVELALLAGFIGLLVNSVNVDAMNSRFLWIGFGLLRGRSHRPSY